MRSAEINETFPRHLLEREIPIRSPSLAAAGPTLLRESRQLLLRPLPPHLLRKTCVLKIGRNSLGSSRGLGCAPSCEREKARPSGSSGRQNYCVPMRLLSIRSRWFERIGQAGHGGVQVGLGKGLREGWLAIFVG